ncbi:MAG TPA: NifU N-terminal domain-containing protein [Phycisphaerales bacterium]|nr:NifU N-terminal domain-containing protein [Phycisphaerales bacterium]HRQ76489.1 NifU N-terminal domain-containing protein [Phycisphaerales bacterium]
MPFVVTEFESTPNPNAVKCWLDRPISDRPRSFLNPSMAAGDPLAQAIFEQTGATTLLFNGDWLTVNKPPEAHWATVKAKIRKVLAEADAP